MLPRQYHYPLLIAALVAIVGVPLAWAVRWAIEFQFNCHDWDSWYDCPLITVHKLLAIPMAAAGLYVVAVACVWARLLAARLLRALSTILARERRHFDRWRQGR